MKFVLWVAKIFLDKDVNINQLKIITETKLILDRRRVRVTVKQNTGNKEPNNQLLFSMFIYGIMGLMVGITIFFVDNIVISMVLVHSYILFMMCMTLITDFSTVLLDTTDNQIILPRPVNSKTFFVARLVHILVYLLQFTIALALFPIIFTFVQYGIVVGFAIIFTVFLTVMMSVFITYLLYGLILRMANEEKVKSIINSFQIVVTVVFAVGYQIVPRLINFDTLQHKFTIAIKWYHYLLPPMWMANALQSIQQGIVDLPHVVMILLCVIMPLFTFWIMIKFLAPNFAIKIAAMGNTSKEDNTSILQSSSTKLKIEDKISALICKSKPEQAGFEIAWKMTNRDKSFKLQFYPTLAYLLVFLFVFVFKNGKGISTFWAELPNTKNFLWFIYLPIFTLNACLNIFSFSENFSAAWRYFSSPLEKPGQVILGAIKVILVKFYTPIFLLFLSLSMYIWGLKIVDDFALGFLNTVVILFIVSVLSDKYLPFSTQLNTKQQGGKFAILILQMAIIALVVGLHFFVLKIWWLPAVLIPISFGACYLLYQKIKNYSWDVIKN